MPGPRTITVPCTSTKFDPAPIAPKSKHSVFPCFMAITARRRASSMALLATTFSALCFLRLHDRGSSSTTTPLYLRSDTR